MWNGDEPVRRSTRGVDQRGLGAAKARALDTPAERRLLDIVVGSARLRRASHLRARTLACGLPIRPALKHGPRSPTCVRSQRASKPVRRKEADWWDPRGAPPTDLDLPRRVRVPKWRRVPCEQQLNMGQSVLRVGEPRQIALRCISKGIGLKFLNRRAVDGNVRKSGDAGGASGRVIFSLNTAHPRIGSPEVGSSGRKSTATPRGVRCAPAALENPEDRMPPTPGRTHNRIVSKVKASGRWNNVGKGSRQNGSVISKRIGSEGWARGPSPNPSAVGGSLEPLPRRAGRRVPAGTDLGTVPSGAFPGVEHQLELRCRKSYHRDNGLWRQAAHSDAAFDPSMSALPIIVKRPNNNVAIRGFSMSVRILKPSKMPRGVWVYAGSRGVPRPGPGSISQGLRASDVACGHRASDASANASGISQGLHAIGRGMCAWGKRRRPTTGNISKGLHASDVACAQRSADVARGLPALPLACTHRSVDVKRGLPTSPLACAHRSADVGRGLPISPLSCTHRSVDASGVACPHRPCLAHIAQSTRRAWPARIGRGLPISLNRRVEAWPAHIALGLCTSLSRRRAWPAHIALVLHTSLSRRRAWPAHIALVLHTSLSRRRAWPARIALGLCTSLSRRRAWPAHIALVLHTSLSRRRAWPAHIALVLHTSLSRRVGRGLPTSPLSCTHRQPTPGVACPHRPWPAHIAQSTRRSVACPHRPWPVHIAQPTPGVACPHRPCLAHIASRRRAWPARDALGLCTSPADAGRGLPISPLSCTHRQSTPGVACPHRPCLAHIASRRRAWPAHIAIVLYTSPADAGRGLPAIGRGLCTSPADIGRGLAATPLDCTQRSATRRPWPGRDALDCTQRSADAGRGLAATLLDCTQQPPTRRPWTARDRPWLAQH
ncbi:hypothetical protein H5410_064017 [Solanum commersonii]|uniref:Uncharacterized protein n=1 Tax=Solanum commersonii TaxID=4109 RepID=A0A9J5W0H3_SOLCO|nr:hypothetical protein H5410_064017 [Solanum commersonii]